MLTYEQMTSKYWKYYLMLESKFIESTRYVELCEENYVAYSIDFANQIISIGSELDVFFKQANNLDFNKKNLNINKYIHYTLLNYPKIKEQKIYILDKKNIELQPFEKFGMPDLEWWDAYNNMKHKGRIKLNEANLKNVLNLLGALFILEMYYYKKIFNENIDVPINKKYDIPECASNLFVLKDYSSYYTPSKMGPISGEEVDELDIKEILDEVK